MPFTFAQADELIQEIDAIFASSESTKFAALKDYLMKVNALKDRLMEVNTLGVGKTAMAQVKEHVIRLSQNSAHQAVLARLLLLIDIHLLEDVHKEGGALMQQALQQNDCNALKLLIDVYGADAEAGLDSASNNALHFAAKEGYETATRFLIEECKMAVNKPNAKGHTALHWAAKGGNSQLVAYLLAQGADVTKQAGNGETPLHRAARGNHTAICKQLIATGKANINAKDVNGGTVLHIAAGIGELELVTHLLTCGADATAKDVEGGSPLDEAVRVGRKAVCEKLITVGKADVNAQDGRNLTALHWAVGVGDPELVAYLLACGADATAEDEDGDTPLHLAAEKDHQTVCEQLLATKKADVNARNRRGRTALHWAAGVGDPELVTYLLACGADVTAQDEDGDTPLHLAAEKDHQAVCEQLLATKKVDVNARNQCGRTALHDAVENGNHELVACLLEGGADVTVEDEYDDTPLDLAARNEHKFICQQLVVADGEGVISIKDRYGNTALHKAAELDDLELVRYLVVKGADVIAQNRDGDMPFHKAARKGHKAICELWFDSLQDYAHVKNWDSDNPLYLAVKGGHSELVQCLVEKFQADINELHFYSNTVLHYAARNGDSDLVAYLLTQGARITVQMDGDTPLHWAARDGHKAACEQLITRGKADVNARNKRGRTALHLAAKVGDSELVAYLLACGADVTAKDEDGDTPLHLATEKNHQAVCEQLLATKKTDVNARNRRGRTALHLAVEDNPDLVAYLLACGADVTAQDRSGITPLHIAVEQEKTRLVELLLKAGARPNIKTYPSEYAEDRDGSMRVIRFGGCTALEQAGQYAYQYSEIWGLLTDFSVIPKCAALVRQETLRILWPLSLHNLLIPPLQNIVAGYVELPEELPAEQKQLTPSTLFVQIELVEQALLAFAQEINNPSLGLTYAARIERLNASAEKIIATLELPESCIHYWRQLMQQQKQIEKDRIAVRTAETLLTHGPAACPQYVGELVAARNAKEAAILQVSRQAVTTNKSELKEKEQKHAADFSKQKNTDVEKEKELADAAAVVALARKIIALSFAERFQYLEALRDTLSKSMAALEAIPRPSQLPDVPPILTTAETANPLIVSTESSHTPAVIPGKQEIKGSEPDGSFAMEDDSTVSSAWSLSQSSSSNNTTFQSTASSNKQEVKETKQAQSASLSTPSSVGRNPSTQFYQPARQKRAADEQAEQEHIKKPKSAKSQRAAK